MFVKIKTGMTIMSFCLERLVVDLGDVEYI